MSSTAHIPTRPTGRELLALLQRAWQQKLTFTIGRSITTGRDNTVVWNGIHHKTVTSVRACVRPCCAMLPPLFPLFLRQHNATQPNTTQTQGGPQAYGYPDPTYLARLRDELRVKGIE